MIPYEVDPSLHPAEPAPPQLDDGFSPPATDPNGTPGQPRAGAQSPADSLLGEKSEF